MMKGFLLVLLLVLVNLVKCYKILAVFPHLNQKSRTEAFVPLLKSLAGKGHEVSVISYYPSSTPIKNYQDIGLSTAKNDSTTLIYKYLTGFEIIDKYLTPLMYSYISKFTCDAFFANQKIKNLLNSDKEYDLLLIDMFIGDCFLGLINRFQTPLIGLSATELPPWLYDRYGIFKDPEVLSEYFQQFSNKYSFFDRVDNFLWQIYSKVLFNTIVAFFDERINRIQFGNQSPMVDKISLNSSLILVNTHFSLNLPQSLVPAVVQVAGIHLGEGSRKLPKDIEKWINDSPEGVIYFSLGSMIKGHTFPEHKRQAFLRAFAKFKQRVLWKWENETMPDKPDNVMIKKWMPQFDILSHPNVRAFISHGGLLGTIEAVHCGVPILVMPQFGDQHTNAKAVEANGGGVILYLSDATEETITTALRKILNSDFRQKTKELSERFRDRPMSPLDTAIYWVEYVARHKGAPHLRTAAVDMPWYVYHLIDVWLFLITVALIGAFISIKIGLFILRYIGKVLAKDKEKTS